MNITKREQILFSHLPASTRWELTTYPVSAALITWYLINNSGDQIGFIPDTYGPSDKEWPFKNILREQTYQFPDVTDKIVNEMIAEGILKDSGIDIFDKDEPDVFIRKLEVIR